MSSNQSKNGKGDPRECAINSCNDAQGYSGDPIQTRMGNFDYSITDLSLPTLAGPLSFQRSYASKAVGLYTGGNGLGKGWTHNQQVSLLFEQGFVWLKGHTANQYKFHKNDNGSYTPYPGVLATLTYNPGNQTYTLTASDQSVYTFDSSGKLTEWHNELGRGFNYTYAGGKLDRVTEPVSGRYLQFNYTGDRLASVADNTGRSISFGYDGNTDLTSFTDVRGKTWTYVYSSHHLTEIKAPGNPPPTVLEVAYDSQGRAYEQWNGENQRIVKVEYNSNGTSTIKDALNRTSTHSYDVHNTNTGRVDSTGYATTRVFGDNFRPVQITDGDQRTTELQWSNDGANLLSVVDTLGYTTTLQYNAQNHLVSVAAPENRGMTFAYNGPLLVASTLQAETGAISTVYTYTTPVDAPQPPNLLKAITDPLDRQTILSYDNAGQLTSIRNALDQETRLEYDPQGRVVGVTRMIDPVSGVKTRIEYDPAGNVVKVTRNYDPGRSQNEENQYNLVTEYTYDDPGRLTQVKDTLNFTTEYVYDDADRIEQVIDAYGNPTHYTYNDAGQLLSVTDPLNHTTSLEYDSFGRPYRSIDPHGHASTIAYNPDSTVHSTTDTVGYIMTYQYDGLKRVTGVSDNQGRSVSSTLDAYGNVLTSTDALGRVAKYEYNRRGLLVAVVENYQPGQLADHQTNVRTEYEYDLAGNLWKVSDANTHETTYQYDELNRPEKKIDPLLRETSYTYDVLGNLASVHYPQGYTTGYAYDLVDRLQSIDYPGGSAEDVSLDYDPMGRLTDMYDSLGHTQWTNDRLGRITSVADPFEQSVGYGYDAVGNRASLTYSGGRTFTYQYDEADLLLSVLEGDDHLADYQYDNGDRLEKTLLDNGVASDYSYDLSGQLLELSHLNQEQVLSYAYQYDLAGNRTQETESKYPSSRLLLPLIFADSGGGEALMGGGDLFSEEDSQIEENNLIAPVPVEAYPAPELEKLDGISPAQEKAYPTPSVEAETSLWQGFLDFVTRILAWGTPPASAHEKPVNTEMTLSTYPKSVLASGEVVTRTISYAYDPLNRLTGAAYSTGEQFGYTYDSVGNRLTQTNPGGTTNYLYDAANQLTGVNGVQYTWDLNGNLLSDGVNAYTYDYENRLVAASGQGSSYSFAYDGLGNRYQQTANSQTTTYALDLAASLPQVLSDGTHTYLYGLSRFAQQSASGTDYFQTDALGSIRQLTDANGFVSMGQSFDPFGNLQARTGAASSSYGFTGEWADGTELQYLRARYYSPSQGRFLTQDIFPGIQDLPGTLHPYIYALNDPVLYTDPSGQIAPFLVAALVGGLIGGGINLGAQLITTHPQSLYGFLHCIDWMQVGVAFGSGAIAGLIGWMVPSLLPAVGTIWGSIGIGALTGALASGGGQIAANLLNHNIWNNGLLGSLALGGFIGGVAGGLGFAIRQWQANRIKAISPPSSSEFSDLRFSMGDPPESMQRPQSHHELPWDIKDWFAGPKRGLNVNSVEYGRWVEGTPPGLHQIWSKVYSNKWYVFKQQYPSADKWQVLFYLWRLRSGGLFK